MDEKRINSTLKKPAHRVQRQFQRLLLNCRAFTSAIPSAISRRRPSHAPHKKVRENPIFIGFSRTLRS